MVEEVRHGCNACAVFLWYPLYYLTSQADTMLHAGVPPEIVSNLDPLALIILIPICDLFIYPVLRKTGFNFTTIKKISLGFITARIWYGLGRCDPELHLHSQSL